MKLLTVCVFLVLGVCCLASPATYVEPKKAGVFLDDMLCHLDPRVNLSTIATYNNGIYIQQINKYLFPNSCGRARGVFTLDLPEFYGNTYSCSHWPTSWNINNMGVWFSNPSLYQQHLEYLDLWLQGIYNTTAVHGPATCDFYGFTTLFCGEEREEPWRTAPWVQAVGNKPLRGVNTGGVFVLEPWITPNFTQWTTEVPDQFRYSQQNPVGSAGYNNLVQLWTTWYTQEDFTQMAKYGLNSIRLPVGWWYFADIAGVDRTPYTVPQQQITDMSHPITKFISMANQAGLSVILDLHGAPNSQNGLDNSGERDFDPEPAKWGYHWFYETTAQYNTTLIIVQMAQYINHLAQNGIKNVIALELLNEPWVFSDMSLVRDFYVTTIEAIRQVSQIPLIIHDAFRHTEWDWLLINWPYENIFLDTHIYHAFNPDDIASSTPDCDHNKMIVAENIACGYGSMMRFKTCTSLPTMMGEWSLAIDDCIGLIRGAGGSVQNKDFGQCKNLAQRIGDPFWITHYRQFGYKQMAMAERELGWFFWTWKTGPGSENDDSVAYWNFMRAVEESLITVPLDNYNYNVTTACFQFVDTDPWTC